MRLTGAQNSNGRRSCLTPRRECVSIPPRGMETEPGAAGFTALADKSAGTSCTMATVFLPGLFLSGGTNDVIERLRSPEAVAAA